MSSNVTMGGCGDDEETPQESAQLTEERMQSAGTVCCARHAQLTASLYRDKTDVCQVSCADKVEVLSSNHRADIHKRKHAQKDHPV